VASKKLEKKRIWGLNQTGFGRRGGNRGNALLGEKEGRCSSPICRFRRGAWKKETDIGKRKDWGGAIGGEGARVLLLRLAFLRALEKRGRDRSMR